MHNAPLSIANYRDSRGQPLTPLGRLFLWCGVRSTRDKVCAILQVEQRNYRVEDGECVIADLEWVLMRHVVMPVRRALTHAEAEAARALFEPDGDDLTTGDFPKVMRCAQFSMVSESAWLNDLLDEERFTAVLQKIVHTEAPDFAWRSTTSAPSTPASTCSTSCGRTSSRSTWR